jgi:hypothetical protein
MKIQLRVHPNEGDPYEVTTNLFVVVAWERKFKRQASSLGSGIGAEDLAFFAYESAKQSSIPVPGIFDDFIRSVREVEVVDSEDPKVIAPAATDAL